MNLDEGKGGNFIMQARILHSFLKTQKFAKQDQHTFCSTETPGQLQSTEER